MLAAEAHRVINLRLAAIANGGPAADLESRLMVTEKMNAALEAAGMLARGVLTQSVISFYRSRVRSNMRRLTRKPPLCIAALSRSCWTPCKRFNGLPNTV